jgi:uncharacterized protein YecE (DUF72 family)
MDSVYHRRPSPQTVRSWCEATPSGFSISVCVPREVMHVIRLGPLGRLRSFVEALEPLGSRLGCLVFTTPPDFECDVDRVRMLLEAIPHGTRTVWDLRNRSLVCPEIYDLLVEYGAAPTIVDNLQPSGSPKEVLAQGVIDGRWRTPFVYLRFRRERYRTGDLLAWGRELGNVLRAGREVYAFFRQGAEATAYAQAMAEVLGEAEAVEQGPVLEQYVPEGLETVQVR